MPDTASVRNRHLSSQFNEQDWMKCLIAVVSPKDFSQEQANLGTTCFGGLDCWGIDFVLLFLSIINFGGLSSSVDWRVDQLPFPLVMK